MSDSLPTHVAELQRILHNMDDHTHVLRELLTRGGLSAPFRQALLVHIRYEEAENRRRLQALSQEKGLPSYEIETLIQHSELLSELTSDDEQAPELVGAILHHFAEEHEWIGQQLQRLAPSSPTAARRPPASMATVGSLLS